MNAAAAILVGLIALLRGVELAYARSNTEALLAAGGIEYGRRHYPLIVLLHIAWLAAVLLAAPPEAQPLWPLLMLFAALQGLRLWIIRSLGPYWTTRIISVPAAPLVRRGPYRYLKHPNYLLVAAEVALLPLVFGEWQVAAVFSALNAAVLAWRIRVESRALAARAGVLTVPAPAPIVRADLDPARPHDAHGRTSP